MRKPRILAAVSGVVAAALLSGCILFPPFWPADPFAPGAEIVVENATDADWVIEAAGDFPIAFAVGAGQTGSITTFGAPAPDELILRDPECEEVDRLEWDGASSAVRIEGDGNLAALPDAPTDGASALAEYFDCTGTSFPVPEPGDPLPEAGGFILVASPEGATFALDVTEGAMAPVGQEPDELGLVMDVEHTWSPDGSAVAFTRMGGEDGDGLHVANADGTDERLLVEDAGTPAWSPEGGRVAYISLDPFAGAATLAVVDVETGNTTELATDASAPSWSPDGEHIAFITTTDFDEVVPPPAELRLVGSDGSDLRTIDDRAYPFGAAPMWSPDGTRLAFISLPDGADEDSAAPHAAISIHDVEAGETEELTTVDGGGVSYSAWSPDGATIAATIDAIGLFSSTASVILVDPASGERTVIRESADEYYTTPIWSPDGQWLAVTSAGIADVTSSLTAIRRDGSEEHTLATNVAAATQWLERSD